MVPPGLNTSAKAVGLRERKKQKTRWAIQSQAMRLFAQQGYDSTTVDQIAAAADISPSTFFRYFPTKEDVVLENALSPRVVEAIEETAAGLTPVAILRTGLLAVMDELAPEEVPAAYERLRLVLRVPALRARAFDGLRTTTELLAGAVGRRLGRGTIDFELRVFAQACGAAMIVAVEAWIDSDGQEDVIALVHRAMAGLENGFAALGVAPPSGQCDSRSSESTIV